MKSNVTIRFAAAAACAGLLHVSAAPATTETVLYNFGVTRDDGVVPISGLTNFKGTLYGTTLQGGVSTRCNNKAEPGCGTVYSITTGGTYKVLHSFQGGADGAGPSAGNLINVNGTLYGTTLIGGTRQCDGEGCGTVFAISSRGKERVVYSFKGNGDGSQPVALIDVNGTLYGTTALGGTGICTYGRSCGTVFSVGPDGKETVLYSFAGGKDGYGPEGGLVNVNGKLYGTTMFGGTGSCTYDNGSGCGTVFSITPDGKEKVLYSFRGGHDGASPEAGLIDVHDTLYGTTFNGGGRWDGGTVFSLAPGGRERVLYRFGNGKHGGAPLAGLLDVDGTLYGTGAYGGAKYRSGMVFSITTGGTEEMVHEFTSTDGMFPEASLINVQGTLYGTTPEGGSTFLLGGCAGDGGFGCGVVFSLKP
jgi:uncharacterized repeat protein (TIGR03803 family)